MLEILRFILASPWHFLGTLMLLAVCFAGTATVLAALTGHGRAERPVLAHPSLDPMREAAQSAVRAHRASQALH